MASDGELCAGYGGLSLFQSALRFAVVPDPPPTTPLEGTQPVSIRFEVRGGSRQESCLEPFGRQYRFQSALRFAVVPDMHVTTSCGGYSVGVFQSALRFAVVPDDPDLVTVAFIELVFQSALRFAVVPDPTP